MEIEEMARLYRARGCSEGAIQELIKQLNQTISPQSGGLIWEPEPKPEPKAVVPHELVYGDRVRITQGFFKGQEGYLKDYDERDCEYTVLIGDGREMRVNKHRIEYISSKQKGKKMV